MLVEYMEHGDLNQYLQAHIAETASPRNTHAKTLRSGGVLRTDGAVVVLILLLSVSIFIITIIISVIIIIEIVVLIRSFGRNIRL